MNRSLIMGLTLAMVFLAAGRTALATDTALFDRQGVTINYGKSVWTHIGPDADADYSWTSAAYVLTKDLTRWFSLETQLGAGYLEAERQGQSPVLEARILADLHYHNIFLQLGTGMARVVNNNDLPGLGKTRLNSILCGTAGFRFPLGIGVLSLGYGVEHISAISKRGQEGDTGWNAGGPRVTVTWPF